MGFFHPDSSRPTKKRKPGMPTELMHELGCKACPRNKDTSLESPKMKPSGAKGKACEVYFLGEAPDRFDDADGDHFCSAAGDLIHSNVPKKFKRKVRFNNSVRCKLPKNRNPLPNEIECCRGLQEADIAEHKPDLILLVGIIAVNWMFPGSGKGISAWRGRLVPVNVRGHLCWAMPILDPADAMPKESQKFKSEYAKVFVRDLKKAFKLVRLGIPESTYVGNDYSAGISWIDTGNTSDIIIVEKMLNKMAKAAICSVDIETQNLKPYHNDSRILTCSITTKKHGTFVFPVAWPKFWKTKALEKQASALLKKFIITSGKKICHNTTFEQEWFAFTYGKECILDTKWGDTMAMGYVKDSRKGMLSLDMLIKLAFGFDFKALSPNINVKRIWEDDLFDVLPYNGLDTKWTLELYYLLRKELKELGLRKVAEKRVDIGTILVTAMITGVPADIRAAKRIQRQLEKEISIKMDAARKTRAWKRFVKKYGRDPGVDSHPDMVILFSEIMKPAECITPSGGISTADEILKTLNPKRYPVAPIITDVRSLRTVKQNFVDPLFSRIADSDGRLHTSYGHLFTTSGRSNSKDPNMQNWVKHGDWKKIRRIIKDLAGNLWVISFDYGQIEARCIAMASKDPTFVQMLWDEYDVHLNWAERIHDEFKGCAKAMAIEGKWSNPDVVKKYRQEVKNKWVFPLFFGSQEYSVRNNLNLPGRVSEFLYDEFWGIFGGIKEWQDELVSKYNRYGYVETLMGLRRYAPCSYNEQINHGIQGTAAELVFDVSERLVRKGIQFNLNITDDLTFLMENDKKKIKSIAKEMCRPCHDFINVPLVVEVEAGRNWYAQKAIAEYSSDKTFNFH